MLRAKSEASDLQIAKEKQLDPFCELDVPSVIGIEKDNLTIRLRSRKNKGNGDFIRRSCICRIGSGTSAHVPTSLCPIHVIWPHISEKFSSGERIFCENISYRASVWMKVALEMRSVPHSKKKNIALPKKRRSTSST